jgi:hypothetical protein
MKHNLSLLTFIILAATTTQAEIMFNASTINTTLVGNGVQVSGTGATLTGSPGNLVYTNPNGVNNMSGFTSTSDVDTLRGKALSDKDTIVFSATITSMTGTLSANGFEFGMSPNATDFRPDGRLFVKCAATGAVSIQGLATVTSDFTISTTSLADGFGVTLTVNKDGWVAEFTGVTLASGSSAIVSGSFTGTEFLDNFGNGHFYLAAQKTASPNMVFNFSEASIDGPTSKALSLIAISTP